MNKLEISINEWKSYQIWEHYFLKTLVKIEKEYKLDTKPRLDYKNYIVSFYLINPPEKEILDIIIKAFLDSKNYNQ